MVTVASTHYRQSSVDRRLAITRSRFCGIPGLWWLVFLPVMLVLSKQLTFLLPGSFGNMGTLSYPAIHSSSSTWMNGLRETPAKILVVYGAPTSLLPSNISKEGAWWQKWGGESAVKKYKYELNTEYFIRYGIQCQTQDTLFVASNQTSDFYKERLASIHQECIAKYGHGVYVMERENKCLDLEAVRAAVYDGPLDVFSYDYFFYINCGTSGPARQVASRPWTQLFIDKLKDGVKMTGLSHNCPPPHIQSMMYALDREGLQIVIDKGAIFDCYEKIPNFTSMKTNVAHGQIVNGYERKMSSAIINAGYGIEPYLRSTRIFSNNSKNCSKKDFWIGTRLKEYGGGRIPRLDETVFFKTTRYLSQEIADEIGFEGEIKFNWN